MSIRRRIYVEKLGLACTDPKPSWIETSNEQQKGQIEYKIILILSAQNPEHVDFNYHYSAWDEVIMKAI